MPTKRGILAGLLGASILYACNKDDAQEPILIQEEPTPKTQVLDNSSLEAITSFNDATITFQNPKEYIPGDILIGEATQKAPHGILEEVVHVSNDKRTFTLEDASLAQTNKEGDFKYKKALSLQDMENPEELKASEDPSYTFSYTLENMIIYDEDNNPATTHDQILLNGQLIFNTKANTQARFKEGLEYFLFEGEIDAKSHIEIQYNRDHTPITIDEKRTLYEKHFVPFVIPGPAGMPVVITPNLEIIAGVKGEVAGKVTTEATAYLNIQNKLQYENKEWNNDAQADITFEYTKPDTQLNTKLKGYLEPKLSFLLYGAAGPFISAENYLKLNVDTRANPWWTLDAGMSAKIGVNMKRLEKLIPSYEKEIVNREQRIAEARTREADVVWEEDFENYAVGSVPNIWVKSGYATHNTTSNKIISEEGNKVLLLYARDWNCVPSAVHRGFEAQDSYEISLKIKNWNESSNNTNQCSTTRGYLQLGENPYWDESSEMLLYFDLEGNMMSRAGEKIYEGKLKEWQDVKVQYVRDESKLIYFVSENRIHEEAAELSPNLDNIGLRTQFGRVRFDDIVIKSLK